MIAILRTPEATYLMQILASAFLAILFLQSGIDKILDRRGNFEWLKGHFAKSPLAGIVPALLICITILEVAAGALSAVGCVLIILLKDSTDRVLRRNYFRRSHHGAVFWAANRERLCWRGSACSVLSAHVGCNVSACATVNWWVHRAVKSRVMSHYLRILVVS